MAITRSQSKQSQKDSNTRSVNRPTKRKKSANPVQNRMDLESQPCKVTNKRKLSEHELARKRLLSFVFPSFLPCREKELEEIHLHLRNALIQRAGCCLYISGVPGTGKTATVHQVIQQLQQESSESLTQSITSHHLSSFRYIEINGLKLTDPKQVYVSLWRAMSDNSHMKISSQKALEHLEEYFTKDDPNPRMMNIVVMDELDILINRSQSVIYNFFEWPNRLGSNLIVVAIANTMDLPERLLSNKVSSRLGLRRINFQPYSHQQLIQIIQSRLSELLGTFDRDAIELCSRKVSAVSGDARKALSICNRALELAEKKKTKVTMELVHTAIKEMYVSSGIATLQKCSFHQKLFMVSLLKCFRRDSVTETLLHDVIEFHGQLCRVHQHHHLALMYQHPNLSDMFDIALYLNSCKCILLEGGKAELYSRIRLYLNEDEVQRTLISSDSLFKNILIVHSDNQ